MRRLVLLVALVAGAASAQDRPLASPSGLSQVVGYAWEQAAAAVPPPDSGAVVDRAGTLVWTDPGDGVARIEVRVRFGTIKEVAITQPSQAGQLAQIAAVLARGAGEPDAEGFYSAAQIRRVNPQAPYLDVALAPEAGRVVYRQPTAPPPAAPPGR